MCDTPVYCSRTLYGAVVRRDMSRLYKGGIQDIDHALIAHSNYRLGLKKRTKLCRYINKAMSAL